MAGPSLPAGESGFQDDGGAARKRAQEFQKQLTEDMAETVRGVSEDLATAQRKPDIMDVMVEVANHRATLTPEEERRSRFIHFPKPKPSEQDEDAIADAEHEALMRSIEEEDAREAENLWGVDDEDDGQIGPPYSR